MYEVHTLDAAGNPCMAVHEASPMMARLFKGMREWDGWCRCEIPVPGHHELRGHAVGFPAGNTSPCK